MGTKSSKKMARGPYYYWLHNTKNRIMSYTGRTTNVMYRLLAVVHAIEKVAGT